MNYPDSSTANTTAQKIRFSSATRALIVGLALLLPGAAALAERPAPGLPSPSGSAGISISPAQFTTSLQARERELASIEQLFTRIEATKLPAEKEKLSDELSQPLDAYAKGMMESINTAMKQADLAAKSQGKQGNTGLLKPFEDLAVKHEQRMKKLDERAQKISSLANSSSFQSQFKKARASTSSITFNGLVGVVPDLPGERGAPGLPTTGGGMTQLDANSNAKWTPVIPRPNEKTVISNQGPVLVSVPGDVTGDGRRVPTTPGTVKPALDVDGNGQRDALTDGLLILRRSGIAVGDVTGDGRRVANTGNPVNDAPGIAGGPYLTVELKEVLVSSKMADNNSPAPSNRGIGVAVGDVNGDGRRMGITVNPVNDAPGISDQGAAGGLISYATALPPKGGDKELPGLAGEPIPGVDVKLGKDPGGIVASSKTDNRGNFHFDKLPAGNYQLKLDGLPDQLLTVGADGIAGGTVMKGSDGKMSIFYRWGNSISGSKTDNDSARSKAVEKLGGFGSGNTLGAGPGRGGPGMDPGMRPGAGPAISGPMSPVMGGGPMGGAGGAMRGAGAGRP